MTKNKVIVGLIAAVVLLAGAFVAGRNTAPATPTLGGGIFQSLVWTFDNGIKLSEVNNDWLTLNIAAGSDRASYTNNTGKIQYFQFAEVELIANAAGRSVASSTMRVSLFGTSTPTLAASQNFTAPAIASSTLVTDTWATSTIATSSNSVGTVSKGAQGVIMLYPGQTLFAYLQAVDAPGCAGASKCEAATSTNRGFDAKVRAAYHFDD